MKKIVYIKYSPLTKKVYEDYCLEALLENGYEVEYWDVTKMFGIRLNDIESYNPQSELVIVKVDSYQEMKSHLKEKKDAFFISMMTCGIGQAKMLRQMTKHHCKMAFWGPDPVYIPAKNVSSRIRGITLKKVKTKLGNEWMKLLFKTGYLHYYDYHFSVGTKGYRSIGVVDNTLLRQSKAVHISSSDYSSYYFKDFENVVKGNYIVFIDQYFPFHPDFQICGVPTIPADVYYKSLNRSFKFLEEKLNMKVVIAAHPKSLRYKEEDFFEGRDVFMGATCPLVKNASLVLAHDSTAIGYAIMSNKPIVLLTSNSMRKYLPEHDLFMANFAKRFSLSVLDMDEDSPIHENEFQEITKEQELLYKSYVYDYCTSTSVSEKNEHLVLEFIADLFKETK